MEQLGLHRDFSNHKLHLFPKDNHAPFFLYELPVIHKGKKVHDCLLGKGVVCDWRNPDVIRVAPHPLYNSFVEVFNFVKILKNAIEN